MEPLDEKELNELLRKWDAPAAPPGLKRRVLPAPAQTSWWTWLWKGNFRVPVPVALAAALVIALWIFLDRPATPARVADSPTVSLADFKPVPQLEPVVVSGGQR
jgi:hypothetical protein